MNISVALMRIMVGFSVVSFPSYLKMINEIMLKGPKSGPSETFDIIANITGQLYQWQFFPWICYIIGGIAILTGFKNLMEFSNQPQTMTYSKKEKNNDDFHASSVEPTIDMFKKPMLEFDFQDIGLNTITNKILEKVKYLETHDIVKKDMEIALIVGNTNGYLKQILNTYMNVPRHKRGIVEDRESPISNALEQLCTIIETLNKIEDRILKNTVMSQKANEIFLKEKMKHI